MSIKIGDRVCFATESSPSFATSWEVMSITGTDAVLGGPGALEGLTYAQLEAGPVQ